MEEHWCSICHEEGDEPKWWESSELGRSKKKGGRQEGGKGGRIMRQQGRRGEWVVKWQVGKDGRVVRGQDGKVGEW